MGSTLKYDRRWKREKQHKRELEQVRENALKFMKTHAVLVDLPVNISPQAELNALENYAENLQELRAELENKWGFIPEFSRVSWWLGSEISNALEKIVKLEIKVVEGR